MGGDCLESNDSSGFFRYDPFKAFMGAVASVLYHCNIFYAQWAKDEQKFKGKLVSPGANKALGPIFLRTLQSLNFKIFSAFSAKLCLELEHNFFH